MTDRELMQMALETLEEVQMAITTTPWLNRRIETIRARLAQPDSAAHSAAHSADSAESFCNPAVTFGVECLPEQEPEPVAYRVPDWSGRQDYTYWEPDDRPSHSNGTPAGEPLYTAPPRREWQGLTDEQRNYLAWESNNGLHCVTMTEAMLREKNA